jgi:hypothetical protein
VRVVGGDVRALRVRLGVDMTSGPLMCALETGPRGPSCQTVRSGIL